MPLFLCYTSHIVHEPLQVPNTTWQHFDFIGTSAVGDYQYHRQTYHVSRAEIHGAIARLLVDIARLVHL